MPQPEDQKAQRYALLPIVEDSDEQLLVVFVDRAQYRHKDRPLIGSKYKDFQWRKKELDDDFGDWLMTGSRNASAPGEPMQYVFGRVMSAKERITPYINYVSYEAGVSWPPVLERLPNGQVIDLIESDAFPHHTIYNSYAKESLSPRIFGDWALRAAWQGKTKVRIREYLSDAPWPETLLQTREPMPQPVRWDMLGSAEDLGECLHPEILILPKGRVTIDPGGDSPSHVPPATSTLLLPATNMSSWQPHRFFAKQERYNGRWRITTMKAYVPPLMPIRRGRI